ncbi:RecT-like ssDNA binding protein [Gordonia phage BoyNamedSue]|uniref:RecT-like ssDNA binding protein n=1 Tax=Gordonia phage BoyNamedSue TaxID=2836009 RepID=A0A8F3E1N5_9CAUD|nr:RecT-like ssDNA binding protein [Gordonia phage BoyNamedSue]QWY79520.1 RecT-like ssDNA binding protein [Gordonia phage BoyNamedSue]QYW01085.1 RecT-like ssDNA binding protein [Gordonia phage AlumE]
MTTELSHDTADNLDLLPATPAARSAASVRLAQQVEDMKLAAQFARGMCYTTAVPDIYRVTAKVNKDRSEDEVIGNAAAAIIYGNALGIDAPQALQNIFSVGGRPAIYARTAAALLTGRGYKIAIKSQSDESVTVIGAAPDGRTAESTWTIERAEKAGYVPTIDEKTGDYRKNQWGKLIGNEKYLTDPQAMLKAKALMEVCRDLAPDVLMGFSADDPDSAIPDDDGRPRRVRNEAPTPEADAMAELRARMGATSIAAAPKPAPEPEAPATEAAEAAGESTESDTAAPSKDDLKRFTALFTRAGISGNSAAAKAKRKTVTEKLIERTVEDDTPLTADECAKVVDQLERLIASGEAEGRGDAALVETVAGLVAEGDNETGGGQA